MMCGATMFKEVLVENDKVVGVKCIRTEYHGYNSRGRILIDELPGTEHVLPADIVIWATGQGCDLSFLPEDGLIKPVKSGIDSDENMMTSLPGVFVAGDVHRGSTFYVVDAIGEGHHAAPVAWIGFCVELKVFPNQSYHQRWRSVNRRFGLVYSHGEASLAPEVKSAPSPLRNAPEISGKSTRR